jgi:transcriptional regulator with XRE-family HTH domain
MGGCSGGRSGIRSNRRGGKNLRLKGAIISAYGSQTVFAAHIGLQESLVSRVVNGHGELDVADQAAWASALGVPMSIFDDNGGK